MEIVKSKLLSKYKNIVHGISTRGDKFESTLQNNLSYSVNDDPEIVSENRKMFYLKLRVKSLEIASLKQIHSSNIISVEKEGEYYNFDALVTSNKNLFLQISIADCVPIIIYDSINNIVAAVHSGWKGTLNEITFKTVKFICQKFNSKPSGLIAFIGPAASVCCYEVDKEVWKNFNLKHSTKINSKSEKRFLDLKKVNRDQLIKSGLLLKNIEISKYCTICNKKFHSYRRDAKNSGRMMALIGMN
ncbi:MAG: peptidoglycan editing factor PgeF [Bacteroidetes bacterium]|nr:peptidoglycan editing factor PgeF [Bacteroidota bacterium]